MVPLKDVPATVAASDENTADKPVAETFRVPKGLWCYRLDRYRAVLGGALTDGGSVFEWLRNTLALVPGIDMDTVMREAEEMAPASHGLVVSCSAVSCSGPVCVGEACLHIADLPKRCCSCICRSCARSNGCLLCPGAILLTFGKYGFFELRGNGVNRDPKYDPEVFFAAAYQEVQYCNFAGGVPSSCVVRRGVALTAHNAHETVGDLFSSPPHAGITFLAHLPTHVATAACYSIRR